MPLVQQKFLGGFMKNIVRKTADAFGTPLDEGRLNDIFRYIPFKKGGQVKKGKKKYIK